MSVVSCPLRRLVSVRCQWSVVRCKDWGGRERCLLVGELACNARVTRFCYQFGLFPRPARINASRESIIMRLNVFIVMSLIVVFGRAADSAERRPMTAEDLWKVKRVGAPVGIA